MATEFALETERLVLEPWDGRHLENFVALAADPQVMLYIGAGEPWERQRADAAFQAMLEHWREHNFGWRSLLEKETHEWLGFAGLNFVPPEATEVPPGEVEIGWWLTPSAWGRGLATEAAFAVRDEAFERVGLDRIIGRYHPSNEASGRIMERLGMHFERDSVGRYGGAVRVYALDRPD